MSKKVIWNFSLIFEEFGYRTVSLKTILENIPEYVNPEDISFEIYNIDEQGVLEVSWKEKSEPLRIPPLNVDILKENGIDLTKAVFTAKEFDENRELIMGYIADKPYAITITNDEGQPRMRIQMCFPEISEYPWEND